MEDMVDTVWVTAGDTMASEKLRPRLSPTMATEDMEATVGMEDMEDMVDTVWVTAGDITASVRLRPSPTMATEGSVEDTEDTEATGATVDTMVDTMASVRPRPSPSMAMEVMEDMVDIVLEVTEDTVVTVMAMASNMFRNSTSEFHFAMP